MLSVGAEKLSFLGTYQLVKNKRNCIESCLVFSIVKVGTEESYDMGLCQRGSVYLLHTFQMKHEHRYSKLLYLCFSCRARFAWAQMRVYISGF